MFRRFISLGVGSKDDRYYTPQSRVGETYLRAPANLKENCLKPRAFKLKGNKDVSDLKCLPKRII